MKSEHVGYFVVEPRLYQLSPHKQLPLDAIMIETMIPKWMGPLAQWQSHIDLVQQTGYNMIHFAPMQQRGSSDSPYSIRDQLLFADDLFDNPNLLSREDRLKEARQTIFKIQHEHGILCLSDVVWNHTSHDSDFLHDHPDAGYNLENSPHLVPAYELDTALLELSKSIDLYGLPKRLETKQDVDNVMSHIKDHIFPPLKLWEYDIVDADLAIQEFSSAILQSSSSYDNTYKGEDVAGQPIKRQAELFGAYAITEGTPGTRFHRSVDISRAIAFVQSYAKQDEYKAVFQKLIEQYNLVWYELYDDDVKIALDNIKNRIMYLRIDNNGPKWGEISASSPLVESYFTRVSKTIQVANNGWIWNADPLEDFASPQSRAYLRRQVICWGDCVKLRYGKSYNDNPWLWDHMRKYTEQVASLFHGIRIDNCHSTPLHVAEYLLDCARRVRPDLYVIAELFTGSPDMDEHFVSRLGIHALIREAMQAWDPHEMSRLVHRHGGKPVGSMDQFIRWKRIIKDGDEYMIIPIEHGSMPRALFMDCTHDNKTPFQLRTAEDALANSALVAFADCATGSVKGYDEIYPHLLDLVAEKRQYSPHIDASTTGIMRMKEKLQHLHMKMAVEGYREVHVHHEGDYVLVHRQHPHSHDGYLLVARCSFPDKHGPIDPIRLHRTRLSYLFGASIHVDTAATPLDTKYLVGLPSVLADLPEPCIHDKDDHYIEIELPSDFTPGSILVFQTFAQIHDQSNVTQLVTNMPESVLESLDLLDCNVVLYRCQGEEYDSTGGSGGVYNIPGYGEMTYAGLEGFMAVLRPIIRDNDLGHPFCDNLRKGHWAMDYIQNRLELYQKNFQHHHLKPLIDWFSSRFDVIRGLPDFLVPKYFSMAVHTAYEHVRDHALQCMAPFVHSSLDPFIHQLALCSVQMLGIVPSTSLEPVNITPTLAAGLPHFTHGCMRTWGRDVFISLRGLLMVTGQWHAARQHILSFASTLRYGLLPNLLDAGRNPRYNARDAVWWFMQSVQDYYTLAPDGKTILGAMIPRRFPRDYEWVSHDHGYNWECTLAELIQEIMQQHAKGIHFREHNAGPAIDQQMKDEGFNIDIQVDWSSGGVLIGGNIWNCGTWMDKMGESERAGNKGYPGTPRDGAPIEITGLLKSTLRWLSSLCDNTHVFPWKGVDQANGKTITYSEWNDLLQSNFERIYYVPREPEQDTNYAVDPSIIHKRGIYKDVYGATEPYTEYQFRPNLCVAMVVAPELFNREHAKQCLQLMHNVLLAPLGMRTLDPADMRYRPYYINGEDSDDFDTAKGRNYHQGPEWIWPVGYYLRAAYQFGALSSLDIARVLHAHRQEIEKSTWAGLPELTNKNGETCWDSCFSQAWSAATILDLLHDMQQ
ncbi:hypothetical protein LRAMOSA04657 [Lichtheimia ramosa]|uniref:Glycogen debranching enzyme n=1 Tax=Lichtheimia ramosa TaxID=688394 RepID=A0A077WZS4_9FUNG|nr:hypothetical protein LRAMOSA04657 [Lichtheimia ramosa]